MEKTYDGRPTLLLVHGAWHRASCWAELQAVLTAEGWDSRTVDLPSTGKQGIPTAGVYEDAAAIGEQLRSIEGPVAVLAHSYGGIPVTQEAGDHANVVHLIYLAAYMPAENESMYDIHGLPAPEDLSGVFPLIDDPRTSLYGDLPDAAAEAALGQLVDQSLRSFAQPVSRAAWRTIPSTYVVCERDGAIPPALQESMSAHAANVERLASGHSPFLSAPVELSAVLRKVLTAVSSGD
ncbi:alpha/beta hydrolase [Streptomyces sp. NPDC088794]|uniref:alpha/beta hydrolase n=1 Tax=Streptomyces sp. NPDC088794 TaxID=3365902 RepID=UPI00381B537A